MRLQWHSHLPAAPAGRTYRPHLQASAQLVQFVQLCLVQAEKIIYAIRLADGKASEGLDAHVAKVVVDGVQNGDVFRLGRSGPDGDGDASDWLMGLQGSAQVGISSGIFSISD